MACKWAVVFRLRVRCTIVLSTFAAQNFNSAGTTRPLFPSGRVLPSICRRRSHRRLVVAENNRCFRDL